MDIVWDELCGGTANREQLLRCLVRLLAAALLGGVLGLERQQEHKAAGMRTHMLVSLAAALFTAVPLLGGVSADHVTRVIQGIATGIGFVGGGVILKLTQQQEVRGLTTAAAIWMAAAIGVAAGSGSYLSAACATLLAWFILSGLGRLERLFPPKPPHDHTSGRSI